MLDPRAKTEFEVRAKAFIEKNQTSFSARLDKVEWGFMFAYKMLEMKDGQMTMEILRKRIALTSQGFIDFKNAEIIAIYSLELYKSLSLNYAYKPSINLEKDSKLIDEEDNIWSKCNSNHTYDIYLHLYPNGKYYQQAILEINKLKEQERMFHETLRKQQEEREQERKRKQEEAKRKEEEERKNAPSGCLMLLMPILAGAALCYLYEQRWGYAFLFAIGVFLLLGIVGSITDSLKNKKLEKIILNCVNSGCIVILATIVSVTMFLGDEKRFQEAEEIGTVEEFQKFINKHPLSDLVEEAKYHQREIRSYAKNRLQHGDTPFAQFYGKNPTYGNSSIVINAPKESDVIVIIKDVRNNNKVKAHAYIHSGKSYTFRLPNGEYQPFFYYGSGWNPQKIHGEVIGGFANGEVFSKDNPQLLDYNILTYTLQLTSRGNFRPKDSNSTEAF